MTKRCQRGKQKSYIRGHTIQWRRETKEVNRSHKSEDDLRLLFTSLVSLGHCIVCPLVFDFCLPLWYLLVIVLSVLWFTSSVYLFGISRSLYCLSSDLWLLFTSLVSLRHCIVCPLIYDFCLPLWYLLAIVLSVLWYTTSVYLFGISWSLYCLSSDIRLLFTPLVSLGHCIVCPLVYDFCISLWYLLVIVLSVLWSTTSVYLFGISWSLYCLNRSRKPEDRQYNDLEIPKR
jgi:hypothetical protein